MYNLTSGCVLAKRSDTGVFLVKIEDVQNDWVSNHTYYMGEQPQGSDKHAHPHSLARPPPPHTHIQQGSRQCQGDDLGTGRSSLPISISVQCRFGFDTLLSTHINNILQL